MRGGAARCNGDLSSGAAAPGRAAFVSAAQDKPPPAPSPHRENLHA
jgi:hypothetical protein